MRRIGILVSLLLATGAAEARAGDVTLKAARKAPLGAYLTDAAGRTLYVFTADTKGVAASACRDACARAWPPLKAEGVIDAAAGVSEGLVGSFVRKDGTRQVTFNGWPLYYFARDRTAGQLEGQDVHGFGGEWYVISPGGRLVKQEVTR